MNRIFRLLFPLFAIALGIIALVIGIHTRSTMHLYDTSAKATVVDIEESWETDADGGNTLVKTPYIDYEVNGTKFQHVLSPVQEDRLEIGDTVDILYQSSNPEKIAAPDIGTSSVIFIIVGIVVTLGALIGLAITVIRGR